MQYSVSIQSISKRYVLGNEAARHRSLRDMLSALPGAPMRRIRRLQGHRSELETLWALKDVSYDMPPGEVLGVVGRNGAGKSTLLKLLSRISPPTSGRILLRGKLASLLEVGTGFHPELTGRENIYLNGSILGMSRNDIARKFDQIVAFAGVEKFLETPVKRFSSGMYVRLAFAVAAHLEPDILVVDEVLAVGDASFQKQCFDTMKDVANSGRSVIFVSHNLGAVSNLCNKGLFLQNGAVASSGDISKVLADYMESGGSALSKWFAETDARSAQFEYLQTAGLVCDEQNNIASARFDQPFQLELEYRSPGEHRSYVVAFKILNHLGIDVLTSWDRDTGTTRVTSEGALCKAVCNIPKNFLRPGRYQIVPRIELMRAGAREKLEEGEFFIDVSEVGYQFESTRRGVITPKLDWSVTQLD